MNPNAPKLVVLPLLSAALVIFPSCTSSNDKEEYTYHYDTYETPDRAVEISDEYGYIESSKAGTIKSSDDAFVTSDGTRGVMSVDTYQLNATVTSIDSMNRKVTLTTSDGRQRIIKVGPDAVNFDQIEVGDRVSATVTEEVAVFLSEQGGLPSMSQSSTVALAPVGAKPGGIVTNTIDATAEVTAVDSKDRHVTLRFPDGTTRKVKVGKEINLSGIAPGDDVTVRVTEAVAIAVRKAS
ncbi:MAG: hypothetical protein L0Y44_10560 [Phycisphaerales bacterium]|nr:hypothetical protein [Phycisphaerales bacterium]MCI0631079.1 hypothetical protein [Phycisphaerales bacterium]MCI0674422.1 hypothetical protein [Phycisphaerales bacterium]